jgi:hypothetical protein
VHVTFSRLMVAASSCRLAFKHARKALTASDRSVQQRQQPSFQLVPTVKHQSTHAYCVRSLTAAFGAEGNHGVKRVPVWVEIALLQGTGRHAQGQAPVGAQTQTVGLEAISHLKHFERCYRFR